MSGPIVVLGEVAEFIRGVTYKPADLMQNFADGSVVCMRTSNVQATLVESDLKSIPEGLVGREKKMLREGDLLVSTANSWNLVGKCCWVPALSYKATAGGFIAILRADERKLDRRYLYHWFSSPNTQADARNCGRQTTNISNMDVGRCLQLKLPLPPLPEQRRIAAILDKTDALRAKRREAIAKLDQLLQSVFLDMFGDPRKNPKGFPIRKLPDFYVSSKEGTRCGPFGTALQKADLTEAGVPLWNMDNISASGRMELPFRAWVSEAKAKQLASYRVRDGDILISRAGTVGKMCVVRGHEDVSLMTTNLIRLRLHPELVPEYFVALMTYCKGKVGRLKSGPDGAFTHMSMGILDSLSFPYPPAELQQTWATFLGRARSHEARLASHSQLLDTNFDSIAGRCFGSRSGAAFQ